MNSVIHSQISVRKRGGVIEDYLKIHDLMDNTKELCSDNRHRILHTMWGIKRVIIPIFGHPIINSDNKVVNVKDLCEQDHILPDYLNRFIPTLSDFVSCIDNSGASQYNFKEFAENYQNDKELMELLLSPLAVTGLEKSLLITHNSWFINEIVPKVLNREIEIKDFTITPADLFNNMQFKLWMDNGSVYPESCKFTLGRVVG
ncbi:hypothetical protein D0809_21305 [Flavobacterium circumlabens]|uniref:DUF6915 domain-containing protein n=1 Tax=Flavobacterium circumlabens TaxID=2133765 RepID=A0A4Y7U6R3_9FLAO|nr:hypothetical protein [Flavobacterium circumlabens]TCN61240.1 hypothetical protein EV142_101828 [Flavobacterium circumlabens]TEB42115.1 hypothetical protein D0809_21305 [Flavobacterium circumlabens]